MPLGRAVPAQNGTQMKTPGPQQPPTLAQKEPVPHWLLDVQGLVVQVAPVRSAQVVPPSTLSVQAQLVLVALQREGGGPKQTGFAQVARQVPLTQFWPVPQSAVQAPFTQHWPPGQHVIAAPVPQGMVPSGHVQVPFRHACPAEQQLPLQQTPPATQQVPLPPVPHTAVGQMQVQFGPSAWPSGQSRVQVPLHSAVPWGHSQVQVACRSVWPPVQFGTQPGVPPLVAAQ